MRAWAFAIALNLAQYPFQDAGLNPLWVQEDVVGRGVKPGTELRILCAGDSITEGTLSGDGNGFRLRLRDDLAEDKVVFAGRQEAPNGNMTDGYFAAWSGKTIQYISEHVGSSLKQRPNIVLLHAGTNDMNADAAISTEGNDPEGASERLGALVDQIIAACPDAVILVAMIIDTCDLAQSPRTKQFQALIPGVVQKRLDDGHHVLAVDFTWYPTSQLRDCIHPTNEGYEKLGDLWYRAMVQIPPSWIQPPIGHDPDRGMASTVRGGGWLLIGFLIAGLWGGQLIS